MRYGKRACRTPTTSACTRQHNEMRTSQECHATVHSPHVPVGSRASLTKCIQLDEYPRQIICTPQHIRPLQTESAASVGRKPGRRITSIARCQCGPEPGAMEHVANPTAKRLRTNRSSPKDDCCAFGHGQARARIVSRQANHAMRMRGATYLHACTHFELLLAPR